MNTTNPFSTEHTIQPQAKAPKITETTVGKNKLVRVCLKSRRWGERTLVMTMSESDSDEIQKEVVSELANIGLWASVAPINPEEVFGVVDLLLTLPTSYGYCVIKANAYTYHSDMVEDLRNWSKHCSKSEETSGRKSEFDELTKTQQEPQTVSFDHKFNLSTLQEVDEAIGYLKAVRQMLVAKS